ncbi:hypothetical protein FF011L_32010 [Roseimaritima multifibrata]|uniref:Uncharacterized protein n=1 Tax=Roseimaritima multifibrata TaxID=1930274 RepID=A0A517MHR9_9BACT|nr:hypothetical protein FF011L_32010 [Roseimaritima multifibrata]
MGPFLPAALAIYLSHVLRGRESFRVAFRLLRIGYGAGGLATKALSSHRSSVVQRRRVGFDRVRSPFHKLLMGTAFE